MLAVAGGPVVNPTEESSSAQPPGSFPNTWNENLGVAERLAANSIRTADARSTAPLRSRLCN